jgi:REP element-mobilizing transposase RayT
MLLCPKEPLRVITHWLKGRTAREANKLLGRTGLPFWRDESWDHYLRMADQIGRTANYIERNPVSAKLAARPEAWRWSSAWAG